MTKNTVRVKKVEVKLPCDILVWVQGENEFEWQEYHLKLVKDKLLAKPKERTKDEVQDHY